MMPGCRFLAATALLCLAASTAAADSATPALFVGRASDGHLADGSTHSPSISTDGQILAFASRANNLHPSDNPECSFCTDVFIKNLTTGEIELISLDAAGRPNTLQATNPAISGDGTTVVFWARMDGAIESDDNGLQDYYVWRANETDPLLVTRAYDGGLVHDIPDPTCQAFCGSAALSHDGRYVVFDSSSSSLVPDDTNNWTDVFRFDTWSGEMIRVSVGSNGTQADGPSWTNGIQSVSSDGRFVVFSSYATNLGFGAVPRCADEHSGNRGTCGQIYHKDLQTGELRLLSRSAGGHMGNHNSNRASMSANGEVVVFQTGATNLVPGSPSAESQVMIVDIANDELTPITLPDSDSLQDGWTYAPDISDDGRRVVFLSDAAGFHPQGANDHPNLFLLDRTTGGVTLVSHSQDGDWVDGGTGPPVISGDGRTVAWFTKAKDVYADAQTEHSRDLFVTRLDAGPLIPRDASLPHILVGIAVVAASALFAGRRRVL